MLRSAGKGARPKQRKEMLRESVKRKKESRKNKRGWTDICWIKRKDPRPIGQN